MQIHVRKATEKDLPAIVQLIKEAFDGEKHSDGTEADLVQRLWASPSYQAALSLVAVMDDRIVGYILFSQVRIGEFVELGMAPLAVAPAFQRQGVGQALLQEGHRVARKLGYHLVIVLGSDRYYPKFGYIPAHERSITAPFDVPSSYFMVKELAASEGRTGVVHYPEEFGLEQ